MTLSKWQPFKELSTIRQQMDRLFEDMLSVNDRDWLGLQNISGSWTPAVEIKETDQELIIKAEIPGLWGRQSRLKIREEGSLRQVAKKDRLKSESSNLSSYNVT